MKLSKLILISFIIFFSFTSCSKNVTANKTGYEISGQIKGISDTVIYLGYYMADKQYAQDTAHVNKNGSFTFRNEEKLNGGLYFLLLPGQRVVDMVIDEEQHFQLTSDMEKLSDNLKFTNSHENEIFYEYIRYLADKRKKVDKLSKEMNAIRETDPDAAEGLKNEIMEINLDVIEYQRQFVDKHNGSFPAVFVKMTMDPVMPESTNADGEKNHMLEFETYKKHFFDNIDFSDPRILRTPVFLNRINTYIEDLTAPHPDSVIHAADRIIEKTRGNDDVFRFLVTHIASTYERSNIMGMDAVFVHMVETYYMSGDAFWMDEERIKGIVEKAEKLSPLLLGRQAPDIQMLGKDGRPVSLYNVDARYTILYFWDSKCGHCKTLTPKLLDVFHKYRNQNVKVFAVNVERNMETWLEYINKSNLDWVNAIDPLNHSEFRKKYDIRSTPVLFVLDKDKNIVAKRLNSEQIDEILEQKLKRQQ